MTSSQGRRLIAAALLIPAIVACRSEEAAIDPYAAQPIVTKLSDPNAQSRTDADAVARSNAALETATAAWRRGDALAALVIANRALLDGAVGDAATQLREIKAKARAQVVASKILSVKAIPEKDAVADGTS